MSISITNSNYWSNFALEMHFSVFKYLTFKELKELSQTDRSTFKKVAAFFKANLEKILASRDGLLQMADDLSKRNSTQSSVCLHVLKEKAKIMLQNSKTFNVTAPDGQRDRLLRSIIDLIIEHLGLDSAKEYAFSIESDPDRDQALLTIAKIEADSNPAVNLQIADLKIVDRLVREQAITEIYKIYAQRDFERAKRFAKALPHYDYVSFIIGLGRLCNMFVSFQNAALCGVAEIEADTNPALAKITIQNLGCSWPQIKPILKRIIRREAKINYTTAAMTIGSCVDRSLPMNYAKRDELLLELVKVQVEKKDINAALDTIAAMANPDLGFMEIALMQAKTDLIAAKATTAKMARPVHRDKTYIEIIKLEASIDFDAAMVTLENITTPKSRDKALAQIAQRVAIVNLDKALEMINEIQDISERIKALLALREVSFKVPDDSFLSKKRAGDELETEVSPKLPKLDDKSSI